MKYRKLGKTDIEVSEISLGCWTLGGLNWDKGTSVGWANVNEDEVKEAVYYALDKGVTHFDNADNYGDGRAERMLSRILGEKINDVVVATKVGWFAGTAAHPYEPTHIRHQCEQSLINLKRDYIDIYYFHNPFFGDNDEYLDGAIDMMYRLKDEGKIRVIGQSAYSNEHFEKLIPKVKPGVVQSFANAMDDRFLAEDQPLRKILDETGISFVAFSPLAQGILLNKYNKNNVPQFEQGDHRNRSEKFKYDFLELVEPRLNSIVNKFGSETEQLSRAALQYLLQYKCVGAVIPGFRNLNQVKVNLALADNPLTPEETEYIRVTFRDMQQY